MTLTTRDIQARCASLGFWPGPIDGKMGARTRAALDEATLSQKAKGLPFAHPSGITRLHLHWTAGGYIPNATDKKAYHGIIDGQGGIHRPHPDTARLAHTLNANGGAIGLSMACMAGAQERPFERGSAPMLAVQLHGLAREAARLCRLYDIPVSQWSTLTHSEVQPVLGIAQRQKWDINWLPGMTAPSDPVTVGNRIRAMITAELTGQAPAINTAMPVQAISHPTRIPAPLGGNRARPGFWANLWAHITGIGA